MGRKHAFERYRGSSERVQGVEKEEGVTMNVASVAWAARRVPVKSTKRGTIKRAVGFWGRQ